jgi:uncharacterized protein YjiS (DUF1127 family)
MSVRKTLVAERESPVRPLSEPERWTPPVLVDHEALAAEARVLRAQALADFGRTLVRLWRKAIVAPVARWIERERLMRELSMLDDRELADLGISRGLIPYIAAGNFSANDEGARHETAPANENAHTHKAA